MCLFTGVVSYNFGSYLALKISPPEFTRVTPIFKFLQWLKVNAHAEYNILTYKLLNIAHSAACLPNLSLHSVVISCHLRCSTDQLSCQNY